MKINYKALYKALRLCFIPTLMLFIGMLIYTLSFEETIYYFISKTERARKFRLWLIIIEIFVFVVLYLKYSKVENIIAYLFEEDEGVLKENGYIQESRQVFEPQFRKKMYIKRTNNDSTIIIKHI